jgi:hypothetical protein
MHVCHIFQNSFSLARYWNASESKTRWEGSKNMENLLFQTHQSPDGLPYLCPANPLVLIRREQIFLWGLSRLNVSQFSSETDEQRRIRFPSSLWFMTVIGCEATVSFIVFNASQMSHSSLSAFKCLLCAHS